MTDYYGAFDCRLYFNHDEPAISFARPILKMKIETAHRGLKDQLVRSADETLSQFPMENNFLKVVRRTLLQSMIAQKFHIQDVAQTLNLTTRSLQRKLKMQGTSFKDMQNQLRLQLTGKLYLDQDRSFDEIAYLLGFSENSAFYRAFKQWTDQPPAKYFKSDFS